VVVTLSTLGTPIKPKRRQPRQGPLYLKKRKRTRKRQGKPQPPSKINITNEDSASKEEEVGPSEGKIEEVTSLKTKIKQPMLPIKRNTTRVVNFKRLKIKISLLQEEK